MPDSTAGPVQIVRLSNGGRCPNNSQVQTGILTHMSLPVPHILITRSVGQHTDLMRGCQHLGFQVSHLPCLSIEGVDSTVLNANGASDHDIVLFTSQNAVIHAHRQCALPWPGVQVHAIGSATANALSQLAQPLALLPVSPFNSESYVQQLETQLPQRLLIIKGEGGRFYIKQILESRHWTVNSTDVYRRVLPSVSDAAIEALFSHRNPDIISIGSNETLLNMVKLLGTLTSRVLETPLLVNSQRCSELARSLGFEAEHVVALPPGDQGQLTMLETWLTQWHSRHTTT